MSFFDRFKTEASDAFRNDFLGLDTVQGKKGFKSKLSWAVGADSAAKAFKATARSVTSATGWGVALARLAFWREPEFDPLPSESSDGKERFKIAQMIYGRTDTDVEQMAAAANRQFTLFFVLTVLALCWGIVSLPSSLAGSLPFPLNVIHPFFLVLPLLAVTARASFRHWQLTNRELGGVTAWVRSAEFMPKGRGLWSALLVIWACSILAPSVALATGFDFAATLSNDDLFHNLLKWLVPGVGPIGTELPQIKGQVAISPYAAPLANAFAVFNATLLSIGGAMLAWHTVAGMVSTAKEGQLLGQRWHEIWAPVRVTVGLGFLAPVAGGYCAAQLLVLQLIIWGGGLGNVIWNGYLDTFSNGGQASQVFSIGGPQGGSDQAPTPSAGVNAAIMGISAVEIVRQFAEKEVCIQTMYYEKEQAGGAIMSSSFLSRIFGSGEVKVVPDSPPQATKVGRYSGGWMAQNVKTGTSADPDYHVWEWDFGPVCGKIILDGESKVAEAKDAKRSTLVDVVRIRAALAEQLAQGIDQFRSPLREYAISFVKAVRKGEGTVEGGLDAMAPKLTEAMDKYRRTSADIMSSAMQQVHGAAGDDLASDTIATAKRLGWASSGMFYFTLARLQSEIAGLTNFSPISTPIVTTELEDSGLDKALIVTDPANRNGSKTATINMYRMVMERVAARPDVSVSASAAQGSFMVSEDPGFFQKLLYGTLSYALGKVEINPLNPMPDMVDLGHAILDFAWLMLLLLAAVNGLSAAAAFLVGGSVGAAAGSAIPVLGTGAGAMVVGALFSAAKAALSALITPVMFLINILLIALLGAAAIHAYVLPIIPFFMMTMFVVGMLILTAEALVAAPLWAFFHIRMDGAEFVDGVQRPGYMIAFNLVLRPALAVFGLILSYAIFGAGAWLTNVTLHPTVLAATAGNGIGLVGILTYTVVLAYLHWQLAIRSFSLITQVPDRVTRWFGQGGENLGEDGEAHKSAQFIIGALSSRIDGLARAGGVGQAINGAIKTNAHAPSTPPSGGPLPRMPNNSDVIGNRN